MGDPPSHPPHRLVAKVLGTVRLPDNFIGALSAQFRVTNVESEALFAELRYGRGLHAFLGILATYLDQSSNLERFALLPVDWYGEMHVLHSLFSVLVGTYDPECYLSGCRG